MERLKLITPLICGILLGGPVLLASAQQQPYSEKYVQSAYAANLSNYNNTQEFSTQKISVVSFLTQVEKAYGISFIYENEVLEGKFVKDDWRRDHTLEKILKANLSPEGLQYKKVGKKQFIIYPKVRRLAKQTGKGHTPLTASDFHKISSNPLSLLRRQDSMRHVAGKVVAENTGLPLAGVSVVVKGKNIGTITGKDGKFNFDIPANTKALVFHYLGYQTQVVLLSGEGTYNISLEELTQGLNEVVVVAYGTQSKASFTGSLGTLQPEAYQGAPRENVIQSLQGNVAGVRVVRGNGQPGAPVNVHIRGKGSINASSAPLYVVDGIPIETSTGIDYGSYGGYTTSGLAGINPDDIASVTVLKDAAATSIYGSRAANGVIIITTKEGRSGDMRLHFSAQHGVNKMSLPKRNRPLNTKEMLELLREGWVNAGNDPADFAKELEDEEIDTSQNTDWLDALTRIGTFDQYYLSMSGGSEKTRYFASGGYYDTKATLKNLHYKRGTARLSLNARPTKRLSLDVGLSSYYQETLNAQRTSGWLASPVRAIYRMQPWVPIYHPDGSYNFDFNTTYNPVAVINETGHKGITYKVKGNAGAKLNIVKGLSFETKEAFSLIYGETDMHFPGGFGWGRNTNGRGYVRTSLYKVWTTSNLLRYNHTFQNHYIETYIGYEAQDYLHTGSYTEATDFIPNLETLLAASTPAIASSSNTEHSLVGMFLHLHYNYNRNYFLSASVRRDGSSRFGAKRRYANFWSVGAAWNLHRTLLKDASAISALKLRSSYGTSGNQGIGNYESTGRYGSGYDYAGHAGYAFTQYENPLLTWEQNKPFDVGVDFGLFNDRLTGSIDYYQRNTTRLLLDMPLPATSGRTSYTVNYGSMKNSGWELSLNSRNIISRQRNGFTWSSNFNISTLKNVITKLPNTLITDHYIREVGGNYYTWYLPAYAGVDPETGEKLWYSSADKSQTTTDYDDAVRIKDGSSMPKFYGGLTNTFTYKNFKLSFLLYYSWGNKLYNLRGTVSNSDGSNGFSPTAKLSRYTYEHRWQKPGDKTGVPKIIFDGPSPHVSTRWLAEGSYIRLRDISLSYAVPDKILADINLRGADIYLRANNLLTFLKDDRLMYDPEQDIDGQLAQQTPINKTIVFGLDIDF